MSNRIIISVENSYAAEEATTALLRGGFVANTAVINYNMTHGLSKQDDYDKYPLILRGRIAGYTTNVYIYSVNAGYIGAGSKAMCKILKLAGFVFDEDDIFTKRLARSGIIHYKLSNKQP